MNYTAQDVENILTALAEEFLVDVPARHEDGKYLIEYGALESALLYAPKHWYEDIAYIASTTANLASLGL